MDTGQLVIKILLIVVFAAFAVFLMLPGRGARHLAIRRLVMLALLVLLVLAIIFPSSVTVIAQLVGVGRGTDLLLYVFLVVFIGNSLVVQRRHRKTEQEITRLARQLAIMSAPSPESVDVPRAAAAADGEPAPLPDAGEARPRLSE